ncbi:MAG: hypothetical protein ACRDQA_18370 [Nocardioidaceae bacterium]
MRLRASEHHLPVDLRDRPVDVETPALQVDVIDPERGRLAPAQSAVAQRQHEHPVATALLGQCVQLVVAQITALLQSEPRQVDADRGISR